MCLLEGRCYSFGGAPTTSASPIVGGKPTNGSACPKLHTPRRRPLNEARGDRAVDSVRRRIRRSEKPARSRGTSRRRDNRQGQAMRSSLPRIAATAEHRRSRKREVRHSSAGQHDLSSPKGSQRHTKSTLVSSTSDAVLRRWLGCGSRTRKARRPWRARGTASRGARDPVTARPWRTAQNKFFVSHTVYSTGQAMITGTSAIRRLVGRAPPNIVALSSRSR